jgi:hypothetical protein
MIKHGTYTADINTGTDPQLTNVMLRKSRIWRGMVFYSKLAFAGLSPRVRLGVSDDSRPGAPFARRDELGQ